MPMPVYLAAIAVVDTTMLLIGKLKINFKYFLFLISKYECIEKKIVRNQSAFYLFGAGLKTVLEGKFFSHFLSVVLKERQMS